MRRPSGGEKRPLKGRTKVSGILWGAPGLSSPRRFGSPSPAKQKKRKTKGLTK